MPLYRIKLTKPNIIENCSMFVASHGSVLLTVWPIPEKALTQMDTLRAEVPLIALFRLVHFKVTSNGSIFGPWQCSKNTRIDDAYHLQTIGLHDWMKGKSMLLELYQTLSFFTLISQFNQYFFIFLPL